MRKIIALIAISLNIAFIAGDNTGIVFNTGFDDGILDSVKLPEGFSLGKNDGFNGSKGLRLDRDAAIPYKMVRLSLPELVKGERYILKFMAKVKLNEKREPVNRPVLISCVEYREKGKFLEGHYTSFNVVEGEWHEYSMEFIARHSKGAELVFTLTTKYTGSVIWDEITLMKGEIPASVILIRPERLRIRAPEEEFEMLVDTGGELNGKFTIENNGKTNSFRLKSDVDGIFRGKLTGLSPGEVKLRAEISDAAGKIYCDKVFRLTADLSFKQKPYTYTTDGSLRAFIGGKPFMPIGFLALARNMKDSDYRRMTESGFNTVLAYGPNALCGREKKAERIENIRAGLDLAHEYGIKIIYPFINSAPYAIPENSSRKPYEDLKDIPLLVNHPAILGWYVADENLRIHFPETVELRRRISLLDPDRPTYAIQHRYDALSLPACADTCDILGVDPYPIVADPRKKQSIMAVREAMNGWRKCRIPGWAVIQCFSWSIYQQAVPLEESHFPTEEEIRAMTFTALIMGAKGIMYYAYHDITDKLEKLLPGRSDAEWNKVSAMGKLLRELEPFIMENGLPEMLEITSRPEGEIIGAVFRHNGKTKVILANTGNSSEGEFVIKTSVPLKSRFGKIKYLGDFRYRFQAQSVEADLLED